MIGREGENSTESSLTSNLPPPTAASSLNNAINLSRRRKSKAIKAILHLRSKPSSRDPSPSFGTPLHEGAGAGGPPTLDSTTDSTRTLSLYRQLSISVGGLICDEHRRQIWPILASCSISESSCPSSSQFSRQSSREKGIAKEEEKEEERTSRGSSSAYASAAESLESLTGSEGSSTEANSIVQTTKQVEHGDKTPVVEVNFANPTLEDLKGHTEWRQVEMDVYRTLARFPPNITDSQRRCLQDQLTPLVVRVLWENPDFRYYQGFHDICLTFLLVLGEREGLKASIKMASNGIFRHFLTEPLEECAPRMLRLIYVILRQVDAEFEWFLRKSQLGTLFALSWLLTWFSHSIDDYDVTVRLYDLFLATHPLMPVYFAAALVEFRSAEVMEQCECEMAPVHMRLSKIPASIPLEALISDSQDLFLQYPPSLLNGQLLEKYESEVLRENVFLDGVKKGRWSRAEKEAPPPRPSQADEYRQKMLTVAFGAVTAGAAAWFLYSRYGIKELSWIQFFG